MGFNLKDDVREYTGCLKTTPNGLVAIFRAPASMLEEYPSTKPTWAFSADDVDGQIRSLTDYNNNPEKPDLDPDYFDQQLRHYETAKCELANAFG